VKPADLWRAVTARGLPILRKDLLEMAVQRRTYLIRFGYALGLFVLACSLFYANIGFSAGAGQTLGRGADHFANLMTFQLAALCLLVPILTAGALTAEKERETLALLLLTTLTPRQIVLQKFASRMTPILSFVFLSFPLMAITYTFGGVTVEELLIGIVILVSTCLVLGAMAIMCSAYCRTTFEALVATYLSSLIVCGFLVSCIGSTFLNPRADVSLAITAVVSTGLCTFLVAACLSMAESILISRAFVPARSHLMAFFHWLDARYEEMNVLTGGIVLVRDKGVLPRRDPVRWRETRKKSLGTFRYLFRVLVAMEVPILVTIQWLRGATTGERGDSQMSTLLNIVWVASGILIGVYSASLISEERSRQTLGVLASTPLSTRRILNEKLGGVHRLMLVLLVPFVTIFVFEQWWFGRTGYWYPVLCGLSLAVYLPLIEWLGLSIGLWVPKQMTAIVVTLVAITCWVSGLAVVPTLLDYFHLDWTTFRRAADALSPADMISAIQAMARQGGNANEFVTNGSRPWLFPLGHFAIYAVCCGLLRWHCLRNTDRYLGRITQPARSPVMLEA
jgi:ABC-type transport system involved in multi-copper enzyme maturation permease subunit